MTDDLTSDSASPLRATVINITYDGDLDESLDDAFNAALKDAGYYWSESGFNFEARIRDIRFRLGREDD